LPQRCRSARKERSCSQSLPWLRRAPRRIDRFRLFRSYAKSRFHLPRQFQSQGLEDCGPLRGHWVRWITNHFAGNMAVPIIRIPAARCALIRPTHDAGKCTPRHRTDAASQKTRLVATESRSCSWICVTSCRTSEPKPNATRCEEWQTQFVQKSLVRLHYPAS
jgi:hypothetical protein